MDSADGELFALPAQGTGGIEVAWKTGVGGASFGRIFCGFTHKVSKRQKKKIVKNKTAWSQQVLGGQEDLAAAFGLRLLEDPGGLSKILVDKLEDHIPNSAQQLADFERVGRGGVGVPINPRGVGSWKEVVKKPVVKGAREENRPSRRLCAGSSTGARSRRACVRLEQFSLYVRSVAHVHITLAHVCIYALSELLYELLCELLYELLSEYFFKFVALGRARATPATGSRAVWTPWASTERKPARRRRLCGATCAVSLRPSTAGVCV